ncbi:MULTISPECIES: LemA family protein [Flavobacterium]|uniref:LemA protein n=3 Tax=Flavobacterium TaxID=237 RepID=A0A562KAW9_9FLAO|nr:MULTISPECIES: LemA family protein [Flavobacterium]MCU4189786.1 LemA family protein [Flavobacterium sp. HXWNR29]MCW1147344.1 LemA family protein [Flavobacterium lacisediminis]TDR24006.1 LemA protein [Flavobacterium cheniae]TWH92570.1 LemA protein [Flavobacterium cheniae]
MRKFLPFIIGGGLLLILVFWFFSIKNGAVRVNQEVNKEWGNVETSYQRRNDLIGNLVKTVQGSADFEKSTLEAVIKARSEATSVKIDPTNMTPEQLTQFNQAQGNLNSSLSRLLVTVEQYPDLKANQNFLKLQDELASTENQILTARTRFNESVQKYNNYILVFPNSIFLGNYKEKPYFDAVAGAEKPVDVEFDFNKEKK